LTNDLHRPLGQKPAKPPKRPLLTTGLVAVAGLVTGVFAIGLVLGQGYFSPPPPAEIAAKEPLVAKTESPGDQGEAPAASKAIEPDNDGTEDGLVELKADGQIAVPTPRPPIAEPQDAIEAHLPDADFTEESEYGVLPRRADDGRRPMDVYSREADTTGNFGVARVVIIVGGMGLSQTSTQQAIKRLPPAVTLAFAPYGNSLNRWMQEARKKGHELLIQVPMEPFGYPQNSPGPHTLSSDASPEQNLDDLHWSMGRITNYVGIMNYQGAKMLSDAASLKDIFDEISDRGLLFLDDGSTGNSQSEAAAKLSILPYARGTIQIDPVRTRKDIQDRLNDLAAMAKRTGLAIGIANGFSDSIEMIAEFTDAAAGSGIEITPLTAIVEDPQGN
jgi:polysaccharide deacetylase 2 family uncharacterized protein YibQ